VLEVTVAGLRNQDGQVMVAVYETEDGFPGDAARAYRKARSPLSGEPASFRFEQLPYGTYAVSVLHDENGNGVVDKNFLGMPKEGSGASNNPEPGFGPPAFGAASFALKDPLCKIRVTIQYP
jgi:uncharacterized protein (DUF2141 family)